MKRKSAPIISSHRTIVNADKLELKAQFYSISSDSSKCIVNGQLSKLFNKIHTPVCAFPLCGFSKITQSCSFRFGVHSAGSYIIPKFRRQFNSFDSSCRARSCLLERGGIVSERPSTSSVSLAVGAKVGRRGFQIFLI